MWINKLESIIKIKKNRIKERITLIPGFNILDSKGYSLLEMMLAMAVGSIILAGTYAANVIVAKQYERIASFTEVQEMGIPTIRLLSRDLRMSGFKALDDDIESDFGKINTPVDITDSGDSCCDSVSIIYDLDTATRQRITYFVAARDERNALYMDVETWDGAAWNIQTDDALVADYIEDFQLEGSDLNDDGNPQIVDVFILFRSQSQLQAEVTYNRPDETIGNYNYSFTDKYHRDSFSATINIRNLR